MLDDSEVQSQEMAWTYEDIAPCCVFAKKKDAVRADGWNYVRPHRVPSPTQLPE